MAVLVSDATGIYESGAGSGVAALDLTGAFTLTAWAKPRLSSNGFHFQLFGQGDCASTLNCVIWTLLQGGGQRILMANGSGSSQVDQAGGIKDEPMGYLRSWAFYAVTLDATPTNVMFYQLAPSGLWQVSRVAYSANFGTTPASRSTNIGSDVISHPAITMSDLRIFKRALNQSEILRIATGAFLGDETYRGYCLGSIGRDLSANGNHIPDMSGATRFRVDDPPEVAGLVLRRRPRAPYRVPEVPAGFTWANDDGWMTSGMVEPSATALWGG
jgi:hypothetical protein